MKFRGNYQVSGEVVGTDVRATTKLSGARLEAGKLVATSEFVSVNDVRINKVAAPTASTDAANKEYVDGNRVKVTMRSTTPNFASEAIAGKDGDILLVGTAPGPIAMNDIRVYNSAVTDIDSDGTNIYAIMKDTNNSFMVSEDGGFSWKHQSYAFENADSKFAFKYMSTVGDKIYLWREYMSPDHPGVISTDQGKTWRTHDWLGGPYYDRENTKWLPARRTRGVSDSVFVVNTTSAASATSVPMYEVRDAWGAGALPLPAPGITVNTTLVSAASYGRQCIAISSAGEVLRKHDTDVNPNIQRFSKGGTLPQAGVLWSDIVAITATTYIACAQSGTTQPTWCYTTDFGATWQLMNITGANPNFTGIHYNPTTRKLVTVGDGVAYIGDVNNFPTINWVKTNNFNQLTTQSITPYADGFVVASSYNKISIYNSGNDWINRSNGGFTELYFNKDSSWPKYIPEFDDANYLKLSGGSMSGNIVMSEAARIVGVPAHPLQDDEVASKAYVDSLMDLQAKRFTSEKQTKHNNLVSIYNEVECIKITLIAKDADDTKAGRYYSEVVMVLDPKNTNPNGSIKPEYTEYAVISTGGLEVTDIAIADLFAPFGNTTLSVTTNRLSNLTVIYEIIDF